AAGTEFAVEAARKQRLMDSIEKVRKHRAAAAVRILAAPDPVCHSITNLPQGIALEVGSLHVDFHGAEDLFGKLFWLAQAAADDFEVFRASAEGSGNAVISRDVGAAANCSEAKI